MEMLFKTVLADDEPSVLEGLALFADWASLGFEISGLASDGAEALRLIEDIRPDLVVCDIRMPFIDGLALMEEVGRIVMPAPRFIILSGYADFDYARRALKMGALAYISKPLDAEELHRELAHAASAIRSALAAQDEYMDFFRHMALRAYNSLLSGGAEHNARMILGLGHGTIRLAQILPADVQQPFADLYESLTAALRPREPHHLFNAGGSFIAVLPGETSVAALPGYRLLLSRAERADPAGLAECAKQLDRLWARSLLSDAPPVLRYEDCMPPGKDEHFDKLFVLPFEDVVRAVFGNDESDVALSVEAFFNRLNAAAPPPDIYAVCLYRLTERLSRAMYENGVAEPCLSRLNSCIAEVGRHRSVQECRSTVEAVCAQLFRSKNENNPKTPVALEREALAYISAHCHESLTLQDVAERFSISALLVGKLVRKGSGRKFNDYIHEQRIQRAKWLIARGGMKIADIGKAAGYTDYAYFIRKFKELTGETPSSYQKQFQ